MGAKALLVIAFGALLVGISSGIVIPYGFQLQDNWNKAMRGELIPFQVNYTELFTVQTGGLHAIVTVEDLSNGFDLRRFFNFNDMEYPFQVSFKNGKLLVSAEIRNQEGNVVAKITDNQWSVEPNPVITYDRNYNSYAFEVVDSDLIPILQVIMKPQNSIFVGGVFYSINGTMLSMLNGTTIFDPRSTDINNYNQTIFQYRSDSHLGQLAPNSQFAYMPTQNGISPISVIIVGVILLIIGTFITSGGVVTWLTEKKRRTRRRQRTSGKGHPNSI
jgi:hypothetical protein